MNEKLVHPDFEFQISLEDNATLLIIENPDALRRYTLELQSQTKGGDGRFVLSDSKGILEIKDRVAVILDPLNIDPSNKKVMARIQSQIKEMIVSDEHYLQAVELLSNIERFTQSIEADYKLSLTHEPVDIGDLHKILNMTLQVDYENEIERVMEAMNVLHDVCNIDTFVLFSIFSFFNENDISTLIRESLSLKHNIIFMEGREPLFECNELKKVIIDKDLCQIF